VSQKWPLPHLTGNLFYWEDFIISDRAIPIFVACPFMGVLKKADESASYQFPQKSMSIFGRRQGKKGKDICNTAHPEDCLKTNDYGQHDGEYRR